MLRSGAQAFQRTRDNQAGSCSLKLDLTYIKQDRVSREMLGSYVCGENGKQGKQS